MVYVRHYLPTLDYRYVQTKLSISMSMCCIVLLLLINPNNEFEIVFPVSPHMHSLVPVSGGALLFSSCVHDAIKLFHPCLVLGESGENDRHLGALIASAVSCISLSSPSCWGQPDPSFVYYTVVIAVCIPPVSNERAY
jgi:hypothetical protein